MTILVVGASGATGKQVVEQLLKRGQHVKIIVRPSSSIPDAWKNNNQVSIIHASISVMSLEAMADYLKDCEGVVSCLGHNLTLKGIYGKPRKLVTDAVVLLCVAIVKNAPDKPVRFILMNTVGNRNRDLNEHISFAQKLLIFLIRWLVPPHRDNEKAADFLRLKIGQNNAWIEWVAVRPDTLIDQNTVSEYELFVSPIRSAVFNPGKTSRINIGHFMAELISQNELWNQWKGQMPAIYNKAD